MAGCSQKGLFNALGDLTICGTEDRRGSKLTDHDRNDCSTVSFRSTCDAFQFQNAFYRLRHRNRFNSNSRLESAGAVPGSSGRTRDEHTRHHRPRSTRHDQVIWKRLSESFSESTMIDLDLRLRGSVHAGASSDGPWGKLNGPAQRNGTHSPESSCTCRTGEDLMVDQFTCYFLVVNHF